MCVCVGGGGGEQKWVGIGRGLRRGGGNCPPSTLLYKGTAVSLCTMHAFISSANMLLSLLEAAISHINDIQITMQSL